jgi:putative transcription factor
MCGTDVPRTKLVKVDSAALQVCPRCEKFGTTEVVKTKQGDVVMPSVAQRLETRQRRHTERDVYTSVDEKELALDYPEKVKNARRAKGMNQEELAKSINEKKSVIVKIEAGEMRPNDKLVKKLERTLEISLREKLELEIETEKRAFSQGMTLGDFIKYED